MSYKERIKNLQESHKVLDEQIKKLETLSDNDFKVQELKKKKLVIKDEISRLTRLQWEEDHERVDMDDR